MSEPAKITIIEGPTPTFEAVNDAWLYGLTEGSQASQVALCRVRTFNGPALTERCYRAWREGQSIRLEFRAEDGSPQSAPIIAARWAESAEGHVLLLWLRLEQGDADVEFDIDVGDLDEGLDDDSDGPDLDVT